MKLVRLGKVVERLGLQSLGLLSVDDDDAPGGFHVLGLEVHDPFGCPQHGDFFPHIAKKMDSHAAKPDTRLRLEKEGGVRRDLRPPHAVGCEYMTDADGDLIRAQLQKLGARHDGGVVRFTRGDRDPEERAEGPSSVSGSEVGQRQGVVSE